MSPHHIDHVDRILRATVTTHPREPRVLDVTIRIFTHQGSAEVSLSAEEWRDLLAYVEAVVSQSS